MRLFVPLKSIAIGERLESIGVDGKWVIQMDQGAVRSSNPLPLSLSHALTHTYISHASPPPTIFVISVCYCPTLLCVCVYACIHCGTNMHTFISISELVLQPSPNTNPTQPTNLSPSSVWMVVQFHLLDVRRSKQLGSPKTLNRLLHAVDQVFPRSQQWTLSWLR